MRTRIGRRGGQRAEWRLQRREDRWQTGRRLVPLPSEVGKRHLCRRACACSPGAGWSRRGKSRFEADERPTGHRVSADRSAYVEARQLRARRIFIRPGPMLLVLPLHGRVLRPTDRALDPWEMILRMPLNIARDPMRRPAVSNGPTYNRSGQPSVPLRVRGLIGEANDQTWLSSLVSSRSLLRA